MSRTYKILVVDDNEAIVKSTAADLIQIGKANRDQVFVTCAIDVSSALNILATNHIDVIVTDYLFGPGLNGDDLIERTHDPFGYKLFVLMSDKEPEKLKNVIRKGHKKLGSNFRFLRKPFDQLELEAKYHEMQHFFQTRPYPFPIEYTKQMVLTKTGWARIASIKDLIETFLKYGVAILMADLAARHAQNCVELKIRHLDDLTFGAWLTWFESALQATGPAETLDFMPELREMFTGPEAANFLTMMYQFKNYRNDEAAHAYAKEDARYEQEAAAYLPIVLKFLDSLHFLTRYSVFVPLHVGFCRDEPNRYVYDVKVLMGTEAVSDQIQLYSEQQLLEGKVYLYSPNGSSLILYPFITFQICDRCGVSKFYMLDRILPSELKFNSICNHRAVDGEARSRFTQYINPLFNRVQSLSQPT